MWNLILLIVVIYIFFKFKKTIKHFFSLRSELPSLDVKVKPGRYRNYHPAIYLTEVVHFDVLPHFGISISILKDMNHYLNMVKYSEEVKLHRFIDDLIGELYTTKPDNHQLYIIFLQKIKSSTNDNLLNPSDIQKAIEFAF